VSKLPVSGWFSVPNALLLSYAATQKIKGNDIAVYCALRAHAISGTTVWPSFETLGTLAAVSVSSVKRSLRRLADVGLIRMEGPKGRHCKTITLLPVSGEPVQGEPVQGEPVQGEPVQGELQPVQGEPVNQFRVSHKEDLFEEDKKKKTPPSEGAGGNRGRRRDLLFDAVAEVTASDVATSRDHIGRVCKRLRESSPPYTPDEVRTWLRQGREQGWLRGEPTLGYLEQTIGKVRRMPPGGRTNGQHNERNGAGNRTQYRCTE
jgi:hypothetical protein